MFPLRPPLPRPSTTANGAPPAARSLPSPRRGHFAYDPIPTIDPRARVADALRADAADADGSTDPATYASARLFSQSLAQHDLDSDQEIRDRRARGLSAGSADNKTSSGRR